MDSGEVETASHLLRGTERTDGALLAVVHAHADMDSVGSAVGLTRTLDCPVTVGVPGSVKASARPLLTDDLGVVERESIDPGAYDAVVVLDAPSGDRIAPVDVRDADTVLVVDHHEPDDLAALADAALVDTEADATAALVTRLLRATGAEPSGDAALALAAGVLDDTGFLSKGGSAAATLVTELLTAAGDRAARVGELFDRTTPFGERVATATAVARADGYRARETLLLLTRTGSDQAAAADALIDAGGDVALVLTGREAETWVVGRISDRAVGEVHLPDDVFAPLTDEFGGEGGGHDDAGTAKLPTTAIEDVERACRQAVERALGMTFGAIE